MRRRTFTSPYAPSECAGRLLATAEADRGLLAPLLVAWETVMARRRGKQVILRVNTPRMSVHALGFRLDFHGDDGTTIVSARVGMPWPSWVLLHGLWAWLVATAGFVVGDALAVVIGGGAGWPLVVTLAFPAATFLVAGLVVRSLLIRRNTQDCRQLTRFVEDVLRARPVEGSPAPL